MKVALLLDPLWLRQEAPTLQRFAVGLVGEQVTALQLCPDFWADDAADHDLPVSGRKVPYSPSRFNWLTDYRIARLASIIEDEEIDAVHALDAAHHRAAARLAHRLSVPLLLECWSGDQIADAAEHNAEHPRPDPSPATTDTDPPLPVVHAAATEPLAVRCRAALGRDAIVTTIRPGVYRQDTPTEQLPLDDPQRSVGCVIVGDGLYDPHYRALIEALARISSSHKQLFCFFYNTTSNTHRLWQAVEQAGLSGRSSFVPFEPTSRPLILQADLIIQPQPLGRVRTLLLEAMAAGRAPLAAEDHLLDYLIEGVTATLIDRPEPDAWIDRITAALTDPQPVISLGQSARNYVNEHHTASGYLGRILEIYHRFAAPTPIAFDPGTHPSAAPR